MSNKSALGAFSPYNPDYGKNAALLAFGATMLQNAGRQPFGRGAPISTVQALGSGALAGLSAHGQAEQQQYARTKPNYQVINDKLVSITPPSERGGTPTVEEVANYGTTAKPVTIKDRDGFVHVLNPTTNEFERLFPETKDIETLVVDGNIVQKEKTDDGYKIDKLWTAKDDYEKAKQRVENLEQSLKRADLKPEEKARLEKELERDTARLNKLVKRDGKWSDPKQDTHGNLIQTHSLTNEVKILPANKKYTEKWDGHGNLWQVETGSGKYIKKIVSFNDNDQITKYNDTIKAARRKLEGQGMKPDKGSYLVSDMSKMIADPSLGKDALTASKRLIREKDPYYEENFLGHDKAMGAISGTNPYHKKPDDKPEAGVNPPDLSAGGNVLLDTIEQEVMPWNENYEKQPDLERPPVDFENLPLNPNASLTDPTTVNAKKSNISMAKKTEIENAIQKLTQLRNMPNADIEALDFNLNLLQQELIKRSK
jgi:hypothetical protein|tara:strand:+ start:39 stop:1490 length:1452 start_codon:yes stop_codon:yes gene_type:complete